MQQLIRHRCSYRDFVELIRGVELIPTIWHKIEATPFSHYLYFKKKLVVNNPLLNECCSRWQTGNIFLYGRAPGTQLEVTSKEKGQILTLPNVGRKLDLLNGDYRKIFYTLHFGEKGKTRLDIFYFLFVIYLILSTLWNLLFYTNPSRREIEKVQGGYQ